MPPSFSVATYNVLASAYAHRGWYPKTPPMVLNPAWRIPALAQHIAALKADILCLQEVEPELLARLRGGLAAAGYDVHYARKGAGRPDGLAIFYRKPKFDSVNAMRWELRDGGAEADSGYIALAGWFRVDDRLLGVINTHLTWDAPGCALEAQRGYRQARHLLSEYRKRESSAGAWIIAGDFNVTPESALATMMHEAGLDYAHRESGAAATCNVNGDARMIDYLYHSSALRPEPEAPAPVDHRTVLPSAEQPSDHVALAARFTWKV